MSVSVLVVGNGASGKTSLIKRLMKEDFSENYVTTPSVTSFQDFVEHCGRQRALDICFWDTTGADCVKENTVSYYNNQDAYIIVYDISNEGSTSQLGPITKLIEEATQDYPLYEKPPVILVGNKCDLERKVSKALMQKYASEKKIIYFETSAKTEERVPELREMILEKIEHVISASRRSSDSKLNYALPAALEVDRRDRRGCGCGPGCAIM